MTAVDSGLLQGREATFSCGRSDVFFARSSGFLPPLLNDELDLSDMFLKGPKNISQQIKKYQSLKVLSGDSRHQCCLVTAFVITGRLKVSQGIQK